MSTAAVTPAESAPAVETPEVSVQERLDRATAPELDTWKRTGEIPAVKVKQEEAPKPAESAPAKTSEETKPKAESAPAKSETAAASPAAQPQKKRAENRFHEITLENRELRERLDALERKTSQPSAESKSETAASQPAADKKTTEKRVMPKIADLNKDGKPKYTTIEEFTTDLLAWQKEDLLSEVDGRMSKRDQERTMTEQQRAVQEETYRRAKPAMEKYPDFMEVAADPKLPIPAGSPLQAFLYESKHPGEVSYYLGKHPEIFEEFYGCKYDPATKAWDYGDYDHKTGKFTNKMNPVAQIRRLTEIEREVSEAPKKEPVSVANPIPPKLPKPPTEVSGRHAAPVDDAEAALARGDTAAYMRIKNAQDEKAARR